MKRLFKIVFILIVILVGNDVFAQDSIWSKGSLRILDTVVVKKRNKEAIELNVHISFPTNDTVILHRFKEFVYTQAACITRDSIEYGVFEAVEKLNPNDLGSFGLEYIIEDEAGNQFLAGPREFVMASFDKIEDETRFYDSRYIVDKKRLKIHFKWIKDGKQRYEIDYPTLIVNGDATVKVYPMVGKLKPGKYKLYLFYSIGDKIFEETSERAFHGLLLSNKIDLIVK